MVAFKGQARTWVSFSKIRMGRNIWKIQEGDSGPCSHGSQPTATLGSAHGIREPFEPTLNPLPLLQTRSEIRKPGFLWPFMARCSPPTWPCTYSIPTCPSCRTLYREDLNCSSSDWTMPSSGQPLSEPLRWSGSLLPVGEGVIGFRIQTPGPGCGACGGQQDLLWPPMTLVIGMVQSRSFSAPWDFEDLSFDYFCC